MARLEAIAAVLIGQPLYEELPGGKVGLASALGTRSTSRVLGLALEAATAGTLVRIVLRGLVRRADWSPVAGTPALLPGSPYWLADPAGMLASAPPTATGAFVVRVGRAISATDLDVEPMPSIKL